VQTPTKYDIIESLNAVISILGRNCLFEGKSILVSKLAKQCKGEYTLRFEAQDGKKAECKLSIVPVSLQYSSRAIGVPVNHLFAVEIKN